MCGNVWWAWTQWGYLYAAAIRADGHNTVTGHETRVGQPGLLAVGCSRWAGAGSNLEQRKWNELGSVQHAGRPSSPL